MDRREYLRLLDGALAALLPHERRAALMTDYEARFEQAGPEGEGALIARLGDPEALARALAAEAEPDPAVDSGRGLNRQVHPAVAAIIIVSLTMLIVVGALVAATSLVGGR